MRCFYRARQAIFSILPKASTIINKDAGRHVERNTMNRKKKLNDAFNKKLKKLNAKLHISNKPKYISKAEREKIALAENQAQSEQATVTDSEE